MTDTDFFDTPYVPLEWISPAVDDYLGPISLSPLETDDPNPLPSVEYIPKMYDRQSAYEAVFSSPYLDLGADLHEKKGKPWDLSCHPKEKLTSSATSGGRRNQRLLSGIAQDLADMGGYRNIDGRLYQYQPPCWRMLEKDKAMESLFSEVQSRFAEYVDDLASKDFEEIFEQLRCRVQREWEEELYQHNQDYLCCRDAVVRLSDGRIFPPDPGLNLFYFINVRADEIGNSDSHYTELFLENITNGEENLRKLVLQMVAAIVTAMPLKKFFFLEGEGNTGKSQFIKLLEKLLGESACATLSDINEIAEKYSLGGMVDKLMCSCPDVPNEKLKPKAINRIKEVAGDDRVEGELKYVNKFKFDCYAKLVFAVLSFIMQAAVDNGLCKASPVTKTIRLPKYETVSKKEAFSQQEYDAAFAFAMQHPLGLDIMFLMETGISRSELLGLRWEDLDLEGGTATISQGLVSFYDDEQEQWTTSTDGLKNRYRHRTIPLVNTDLIARLKDKPHEIVPPGRKKPVKAEYVFHSPSGKPYQPNNWANRVYRPFMRDLLAAHPELPELSAHELRHTRATLWVAQGVDPLMVIRLLGHCDMKTLTKIYDHTTVETLRKALTDVSTSSEQ